MQLDWLTVADFRSYPSLEWNPDPGVNILVGPNGAGKTNLLEAVGFLSRLRSFRGAPDEALVARGAVSAVVRGGLGDTVVEVEFGQRGGRRARIDGKPIARTTDLMVALRTVTFVPEDLDIVKGGPQGRRAMIDEVAEQIWPSAGLDQAEYERALRQRNAYLKQSERDPATLEVWDARLAQAAGRLMARRARVALVLSETLPWAYTRIAGDEVAVGFAYQSDWGGNLDPKTPPGEWSQSLLAALVSRRRSDYELRITTAGPHRDDPGLELAGRSSRHHASQGEQRTLALALRLAIHRAVTDQVGVLPLLLLDDVYSELDPGRAKALTDALPPAQTLISTTRLDEVPVPGRVWEVGHGEVR